MKWNYICPVCKKLHTIDWDDRNAVFTCNKDEQKTHVPPKPSEQHHAYVDTHHWPVDMEDVVVAIKGNQCMVSGCKKRYETLDHHIAFSKGGKTSVENLFPMCKKHNDSKGDFDYSVWILSLELKK